MSIEDRDWYREEYKKKQERESDKKVRDSYYNPKEFRTNTKIYQGVNKRERIKTVKITPKISIVKASLICIFLVLLTFSATMLVFVTKPTLLNMPYQIALKIINVL